MGCVDFHQVYGRFFIWFHFKEKQQRPSLGGEKPTVPRKIIGTLTLSISNSVNISISPIFL